MSAWYQDTFYENGNIDPELLKAVGSSNNTPLIYANSSIINPSNEASHVKLVLINSSNGKKVVKDIRSIGPKSISRYAEIKFGRLYKQTSVCKDTDENTFNNEWETKFGVKNARSRQFHPTIQPKSEIRKKDEAPTSSYGKRTQTIKEITKSTPKLLSTIANINTSSKIQTNHNKPEVTKVQLTKASPKTILNHNPLNPDNGSKKTTFGQTQSPDLRNVSTSNDVTYSKLSQFNVTTPIKPKLSVFKGVDIEAKNVNTNRVDSGNNKNDSGNNDLRYGTVVEENICLRIMNEERRKEGKPPLKLMPKLTAIAQPHSIAMILKQVPVGHQGAQQRFDQMTGSNGCGENVAMNHNHAHPIESMTEGWLKSPGHRANILGNFTHVGNAFVTNNKGTWYGTQLFGHFPNEIANEVKVLTPEEERTIINEINKMRKQKGLSQVSHNPGLKEVAEDEVVKIATKQIELGQGDFKKRCNYFFSRGKHSYSEQRGSQYFANSLSSFRNQIIKSLESEFSNNKIREISMSIAVVDGYYAFYFAFLD
ncbi:hypothetical protein TRFO_04031 [Tritrichomonas foetus]|uniref:SCP domain-containing protein n=1 Tax=Tritrichomonas foetus TaxID=1144522 RepID=A0A1J4KJ25_9EUKA|nr:hypothetical protein TRFO_04031 [Tritrichomonas foetus]|eukprot:OHT11090.1 hypothetical protein TRFO_04031 [Tritrichomonas foetus]